MNQISAPENELLVPFEGQHLPEEYKEYYRAKRQNFFASIEGFSEIFGCYMLLDRIWLREFQDAKVASDPSRMFPLILYFNAHAKIRVGMELALSGCLRFADLVTVRALQFDFAIAVKMGGSSGRSQMTPKECSQAGQVKR